MSLNVVGDVLLGIGIVLIWIGYVRKSRNLMLLAAALMMVGAGLTEMVKGFIEGWKAGG